MVDEASFGHVEIARLGWGALTERSWTELLGGGLPLQLVELSRDLGQCNERPIRVFTLSTLEAGVAGLAVPFVHDDGILFDPWLLGEPGELRRVIARELAHLLYPGWADFGLDRNYDQMEAFSGVLAPMLLGQLPQTVRDIQPMVDAVMASFPAAWPSTRASRSQK